MEGIRQIFSRGARFLPKTQAQALAALAEGIVDESVFIWKAVNIHPVFEEPWDFNEIERLLAKEDLDLDTTLLLMTIFERLIRDPDKESALFAAESINSIEQRYARRARALRDEATASEQGTIPLRRLAALYRDFGMVCFARPVLKAFYLREALAVIEELRASRGDAGEELSTLEIGVLLEMGEALEARRRIDEELAEHPKDKALLLLAARARFEARDWQGVTKYLEIASSTGACEDIAPLLEFWTNGVFHD
jgi:hypothetical protein